MLARWTHNDMESLVRSIARYTRFVRSTKLTAALLAFALIAILLLYPVFREDEGGIRVAFTSIQKGAASPTQMINAKFNGLDKKNQPYHVNADTATQRDENTMDLVKVTADIALNTGKWLSISSNTGTFSTQTHQLQLNGAVDAFTDDGYEFRAQNMAIDMTTKIANTLLPVQGQGPLGTLHAEHGVIINSNTKVANFAGPIKVVVYPPESSKTPVESDTPVNQGAK